MRTDVMVVSAIAAVAAAAAAGGVTFYIFKKSGFIYYLPDSKMPHFYHKTAPIVNPFSAKGGKAPSNDDFWSEESRAQCVGCQ